MNRIGYEMAWYLIGEWMVNHFIDADMSHWIKLAFIPDWLIILISGSPWTDLGPWNLKHET